MLYDGRAHRSRDTTNARVTLVRTAPRHSLCLVRGWSDRFEAARVPREGRAHSVLGTASAQNGFDVR